MYAISAAHFIIMHIPEWLDKINSVVLFGSVAQGSGDKNSDIDIFIDAKISENQKTKLHSAIRKSIAQFHLSQEGLAFKMEGIANEISVLAGDLDVWKEMQRSISASGIVLYGKYKKNVSKEGLKHYVLVFWEAKRKNRGAFLNKMYGYKIKGKKYKGLIEKYNGNKIGKSAAIIPMEHKDVFFNTLEHYSLNYKIMEVFAGN